jgi:serine/threonine protein phosphatase 1
MRTLAIGDIHGCLTAFDLLLGQVQPKGDDILVFLGDVTDRGPDTRGVIDRIIELQSRLRVVPILGNHDEMVIHAFQGKVNPVWLYAGGRATLASYGHKPEDVLLDWIPAAHREHLLAYLPYYETDTHIFAHALVNPELPLGQQDDVTLRWAKLDGPIQHVSGKTLICGHTKQRSGNPLVMPGTICIDTGAYDPNGWLTCLDVGTGEYWQTSQKGGLRQGRLAEAK